MSDVGRVDTKHRKHVAHLDRMLERDYKSIIEAIGWICADTAQWTAFNSKSSLKDKLPKTFLYKVSQPYFYIKFALLY